MSSALTHEEWLARRRSGIGGSDVAGILGISPWTSPLSVWLDKTGRSAPSEGSVAMRIGTELEPLVATMYEEATGRKVRRHNALLRDGCLVGNVDRLVVPDGHKVAARRGEILSDRILECKTSRMDWEDGVPLYYQTQVQHYMGLVPTARAVDVAVLFIGRNARFEVYTVERDQATIEAMQARLRDWWERYVVTDTPPPAESHEEAIALYPKGDPALTAYASTELVGKLAAYKAAKDAADKAAKDLDRIKGEIEGAMGEAEWLKDNAGKVLATWKTQPGRTSTDWEGVARALGTPSEDLVAEHTKAGKGFRRFTVK